MSIGRLSPNDPTSRAREHHDDDTRQSPPAARSTHDVRLAGVIDRLPTTGNHATYFAAVTPPDPQRLARDEQVRATLDACRDRASGPYSVNGQAVAAAPMFRMTTHRIGIDLRRELASIGNRAGIKDSEVFALTMGQGSSGALVKLTQALIDAGKLPSAPRDLASRIKTMQWSYGIGMDCAGYSKEALRAVHGARVGFYAPGIESFRDLDGTRRAQFARVSLEGARPGDLMTLDAAPGGTFGHNVVVYRNDIVDVTKQASLVATYGADMAAFLASAGPHRALEVDSSWGAGLDGAMVGGYRRDTWLYDTSTKQWASFTPGTKPPELVLSRLGPADDVFHGVYRPR